MGEIEIRNYDGFRAAVAALNGLAGQIPGRRDAGAKVSAAASAAADNEGATAPVYVQSLTALIAAIDGANGHVDAAAAAVSAALGELEMVLTGMQGIDEGTAEAVQNV